GADQREGRDVAALDAADVEGEQAAVVLHEVRDGDAGPDGDDRPDAQVVGQPDQRRDEGQRVRRDVGEQGAPGHRVRAQTAVFVDRLPVGLEKVITHQV